MSRDTKNSAPSQACNAKTARSIAPEQVKQVGNSWGKALAHEKRTFHGQFAKILRASAPKRAFSQPRERKASKDTTQRPPRPCATSSPPRARPSGRARVVERSTTRARALRSCARGQLARANGGEGRNSPHVPSPAHQHHHQLPQPQLRYRHTRYLTVDCTVKLRIYGRLYSQRYRAGGRRAHSEQSEKVDLILPDPPVNVLISNGCAYIQTTNIDANGQGVHFCSRVCATPVGHCRPNKRVPFGAEREEKWTRR